MWGVEGKLGGGFLSDIFGVIVVRVVLFLFFLNIRIFGKMFFEGKGGVGFYC